MGVKASEETRSVERRELTEAEYDRIEELELQALHAQLELARELEEVRRSFRAELVPFPNSRPPGKEIVRAADARSPFRGPLGKSRGAQKGAGS